MENDIFFKKTPRVSLSGALRFFGVRRGSYAASIIRRLYDYYCRGADSLYIEYIKYYKKEFPSFESFLGSKYNLFPEEIDKYKSFFLFHKSVSFEADGNITNIVEETSIKDTLKRFLGDNHR